jgi:5'-nucleotidase
MHILLSNDDGYDSDGLRCLEKTLGDFATVWTVAPDQGQSAMGRAITLHRPLKVMHVAERHYKVNGTPSDCVNLAVNGVLPVRPDLVISGINQGANMGDDISYSGTAAAAFEAAILGIPAFAVSLATKKNFNFMPAARFAAALARSVIVSGLPPYVFLNVNVPDTGGADIFDYAVTHQGRSRYEKSVTPTTCPREQTYYWLGGKGVAFEDIDSSDANAVRSGLISITPIRTDLTDYDSMSFVSGLSIKGFEIKT